MLIVDGGDLIEKLGVGSGRKISGQARTDLSGVPGRLIAGGRLALGAQALVRCRVQECGIPAGEACLLREPARPLWRQGEPGQHVRV